MRALIEQWLKNKDTVLFLGVWEQINNPGFNSLEFEGIRNEAGRNSFYLSARSGSMPQAPSACTPRPAGTVVPMPTATLPSSSAPGFRRFSLLIICSAWQFDKVTDSSSTDA
jgi:hypothetical protein